MGTELLPELGPRAAPLPPTPSGMQGESIDGFRHGKGVHHASNGDFYGAHGIRRTLK